MASEVIDFTGSPPSLPRLLRTPRILLLRPLGSVRRSRFRRAARNLCLNPNRRYANSQMPPCVPRQPSNGTANVFQVSIHGDQVQAVAIYEPITEFEPPSLFPNRENPNEPWTPTELFVTVLIQYWTRRWGRIAGNSLWNWTPQQLHQRYGEDFLRTLPLPYTISHNNRNMNPTYATAIAADLMNMNENLMGVSASFSNAMMPNEPEPLPITLTLFPEEAPFFPVPPAEVCSSSFHGFQMQTSTAVSTLMTASDGENLELSLG